MMPVLFSIGQMHIYSFSVALILAWLISSFLFWRALRENGIDEERIFDLTFYATIMAFIISRAAYVGLHTEQFTDNPVKIAAMWVAPGMSLYGALVGALVVVIYLSRRYKVRLGLVLDALAPAFGLAFIVGALGAFMDGTYAGTPVRAPWAIRYIGYVGLRHPVQIYEIIAMIIILSILAVLSRRARVNKWPYGLLALWFFALFSVGQFVLEFAKDSRVYLGTLRANQWILVAFFAETMGAFYVRGGGREKGRYIWYIFQAKSQKVFAYILKKKKND